MMDGQNQSGVDVAWTRSLLVVLVILGMLTGVTGRTVAAETDVDPSDLPGSGTASDPYVITNASELQAMEDDLSAHYTLGSDVDASGTSSWNGGSGFDPIGDSGAAFTGSFNGSDHTITGLTIDRSSTDYVGLFGYVDGATIEHVGLDGADVTGNNDVGALVGFNTDGTINVTYATGSVSGADDVGGLVGYTTGTGSGLVNNSYSMASVSGTDGVGGLVGTNAEGSSVENSFSTGSVSGSSNVGGLVGGGVASETDAYWDTESSGQSSSSGGTGLTTSEMQGSSASTNMAGLDFSDTWQTVSGDYPAFAWESVGGGGGSAPDPAFFDVEITDVNESVAAGESVVVEYRVRNTGGRTATQDITLGVEFEERASDRVKLTPDESTTGTFTYVTAESDVPSIDVEVASENNPEDTTVTVHRPVPLDVTAGETTIYAGTATTFTLTRPRGDATALTRPKGGTTVGSGAGNQVRLTVRQPPDTITTVQGVRNPSGGQGPSSGVSPGQPGPNTPGAQVPSTGTSTGQTAPDTPAVSGGGQQGGQPDGEPTSGTLSIYDGDGTLVDQVHIDGKRQYTFDRTGTYRVVASRPADLDADETFVNDSVSLTVRDPPDETRVTGYNLSSTQLNPEETLTVTAFLFGGTNGSIQVPLRVDGATVATRTVTLDPGERRTVTFSRTFDGAGTHAVGVGPLPATDVNRLPCFRIYKGRCAADTTGNGLLNDLNADGDYTHLDGATLWRNKNSPVFRNNPGLFDFDTDGEFEYTSDLDALYAGTGTTETDPARFVVTVLDVTDDGTVEYRVTNTGEGTDTQDIRLRIGGEVQSFDSVTLVPDGAAVGTFEFEPPADGRIEVASEDTADDTLGNAPVCEEVTYDGKGTDGNPYEVGTLAQLQCIGHGGNAGLDDHYVLTSDIDATPTRGWHDGAGFDPIGESARTPFSGSVAGRHHTISNLSVTRPGTTDVGLFAANTGTVSNLTLAAVSVTGDARVGGLVGDNRGTVRGVRVTGGVGATATVGGVAGKNTGTVDRSSASSPVAANTENAGGLVGDNQDGTVERSFATGNVAGPRDAGGLVGDNQDGTVSLSYATGRVEGTVNAGGLVGNNEDGTISVGYARGAVRGTDAVGGLAGFNGGTIEQAYAVGDVFDVSLSERSDDAGAVVGTNGDGTVRAAYWDEDTTRQARPTPGTGLSTAEMTGPAASGNMTGLDFGGPWRHASDDYPVFAWQNIPPRAGADSYGVDTDRNLTVGAPGLLGNDRDPEGERMTVSVQSGPANGDLTLSPDGSFTYDPDDGFTGRDTFTYRVSDGNRSATATVTLNVRQYRALDPSVLAGSGTATDPYVITNASGLQAVEKDLDAHYALGANIGASDTATWNGGAGFDPIGDGEQPFTGTFDGQGHTISGLAIDRPDTENVGLFANSAGTVRDVTLNETDVTGNEEVGALVGHNTGTVTSAGAFGRVEADEDEAGGLVGYNAFGEVEQSTANVTVTGANKVGGLVGFNKGTVRDSRAEGAVTGTGTFKLSGVGGLVGDNRGTVADSTATGTVAGNYDVGGLVGHNFLATVRDSVAEGVVTGHAEDSKKVGGLVGNNIKGTITASSASGAVTNTGTDAGNTGGLVGQNIGGTVHESSASGPVAGNVATGGLVGKNERGDITDSSASGTVTGDANRLGGLVGTNADGSRVERSFATGSVRGNREMSHGVGGLVGRNLGTITRSYATGNVTGEKYVGGLVGRNGFDENGGVVEKSYARGAVGGIVSIGGLVGNHSEGTIEETYATGAVDGDAALSEGLTGGYSHTEDTVRDSYWDTLTTGETDPGEGTPLTTYEMTGESAIGNMRGFDFENTWEDTYSGYPILAWQR